jgi:hypothetical protein
MTTVCYLSTCPRVFDLFILSRPFHIYQPESTSPNAEHERLSAELRSFSLEIQGLQRHLSGSHVPTAGGPIPIVMPMTDKFRTEELPGAYRAPPPPAPPLSLFIDDDVPPPLPAAPAAVAVASSMNRNKSIDVLRAAWLASEHAMATVEDATDAANDRAALEGTTGTSPKAAAPTGKGSGGGGGGSGGGGRRDGAAGNFAAVVRRGDWPDAPEAHRRAREQAQKRFADAGNGFVTKKPKPKSRNKHIQKQTRICFLFLTHVLFLCMHLFVCVCVCVCVHVHVCCCCRCRCWLLVLKGFFSW